MLVYRTQAEEIDPALEIRRLRTSPRIDVLMRLGEIESAVCDLGHPAAPALRRAILAAARGHTALDELAACELPGRIRVSVPEGYAYYALYPEMYAEAARRFYRAVRPERAVVIGIRSIGTSLSAVVAAALEDCGCEVDSWTVRPRGHPFHRMLELEHPIDSRPGTHYAIVDEGPGLSGTSLTSVAAALGLPDERISFFPSWLPDGSAFLSQAARERWRRHARWAVAFEEVLPCPAPDDISAGKWRERFSNGAAWPAVQPQHERRKYLGRDFIARFAGLGRFGRARLARAEQLAAAGFAPEPLGLDNGFLHLRLVRGGTPQLDRDLLDAMARYLRFLAAQPESPRGVTFDGLLEMIEVNTGRAGPLEPFRRAFEDAKSVAIDGRMLPHEWLRTETGFVKTDALDHHDDHFFPGPQNIAWDVAGACVEWDLDTHATEYLAARCGDAGLAARLPFYRIAYSAFRAGYAALASQALAGTPDAARFEALARRYRR